MAPAHTRPDVLPLVRSRNNGTRTAILLACGSIAISLSLVVEPSFPPRIGRSGGKFRANRVQVRPNGCRDASLGSMEYRKLTFANERIGKLRGGEGEGEGEGERDPEASLKEILSPVMNLSYAESQHQKALDLLREDKLEHAIDILSDVLEWRTKTFGEKAIECAATWHHYGVALFKKARSSRGIMGEATKEGIRQLSREIVSKTLNVTVAADDQEKEMEKEDDVDEDADADDDAEEPYQGEDDVDKQVPEGQKGQKQPEQEQVDAGIGDVDNGLDDIDLAGMQNNITGVEGPDDMELAWQALEVARLIYSENESRRIADRRLADLQFRLCLALQLDGTQKLVDNRTEEGRAAVREGVEYCNKTSHTIQTILSSVEAAKPTESTANEIKELKEILSELEDKKTEMAEILTKGVELPKLTDNNDPEEIDESKVHDLGVVGSVNPSGYLTESLQEDGAQKRVGDLHEDEEGAKRLRGSEAMSHVTSQTPAAD
ncbi:hypothetical protein AAMO2058_000335800 [Amorphochlora amoebiformis]